MNSSNPRFASATAPNQLEKAGEAVKEKAEGLGSAMAETAKTVKDNAKELASSAAKKAEQAWDSAKETAEEFGSEVARRAETAYADSVIFIRRNPLASICGAAGVGLLLGLVVSASFKSR